IEAAGKTMTEQGRSSGIVVVDVQDPNHISLGDRDFRVSRIVLAVGDARGIPGATVVSRTRDVNLRKTARVLAYVRNIDITGDRLQAIHASLLRARATLPLPELPKLGV